MNLVQLTNITSLSVCDKKTGNSHIHVICSSRIVFNNAINDICVCYSSKDKNKYNKSGAPPCVQRKETTDLLFLTGNSDITFLVHPIIIPRPDKSAQHHCRPHTRPPGIAIVIFPTVNTIHYFIKLVTANLFIDWQYNTVKPLLQIQLPSTLPAIPLLQQYVPLSHRSFPVNAHGSAYHFIARRIIINLTPLQSNLCPL